MKFLENGAHCTKSAYKKMVNVEIAFLTPEHLRTVSLAYLIGVRRCRDCLKMALVATARSIQDHKVASSYEKKIYSILINLR